MEEVFDPFELPEEEHSLERHLSAPGQSSVNKVAAKMEHSILKIVRERLTALGLAQIPPSAVSVLASKLAHQAREQAVRSITPRAVARAILAPTSGYKSTSPASEEVSQNLSPKA